MGPELNLLYSASIAQRIGSAMFRWAARGCSARLDRLEPRSSSYRIAISKYRRLSEGRTSIEKFLQKLCWKGWSIHASRLSLHQFECGFGRFPFEMDSSSATEGNG